MPFTFSHPAIVLPLHFLSRRWVSLTGLVVGSMTPDFEYFLRMKVQSKYSHTLSGLFWFDLPLGILLAFVFHTIVRNCLFVNLPGIVKVRVLKFKDFAWAEYFRANWFIVILSVLVGAASHLLWDNFTHANGYFVTRIPGLMNSAGIFGTSIPVFKIAQHLSSLLGGITVFYCLWGLPSDDMPMPGINGNYWYVLLGLSSFIVAIRLMTGLDYHQYGQLIVTALSAMLISLILTPTLVHRTK